MRLATNYVAGLAGVDDDVRLVELLRAGDERAFAALIDRYHTVMLRLATVYVRDRVVAQDVVQDTWVGVLRGLDRFEARSRLKTWIFHILVNTARTRALQVPRVLRQRPAGRTPPVLRHRRRAEWQVRARRAGRDCWGCAAARRPGPRRWAAPNRDGSVANARRGP